jgi:hypothetical protein
VDETAVDAIGVHMEDLVWFRLRTAPRFLSNPLSIASSASQPEERGTKTSVGSLTSQLVERTGLTAADVGCVKGGVAWTDACRGVWHGWRW